MRGMTGRAAAFGVALMAVLLDTTGAAGGILEDLDRELTAVAARVSRSLVTVTSEPDVALKREGTPGWPQPVKAGRRTASGVVYDRAGHIVTVASSVPPGRRVKVTLADGRTLRATVRGRDPVSNLAVLEVNTGELQGKELVPVRWGRSADVRPGALVLAVGSSFGMGPSVTLGVVSAVERSVGGHADLIQITAPINPGDSGGMLVNSRGELVGIISATFGRAPSGEWLRDFFREMRRRWRVPPALPDWFERFEPERFLRPRRDVPKGDRERLAEEIEVLLDGGRPGLHRGGNAWELLLAGPGLAPEGEVSVTISPSIPVGSQGMNYAIPADEAKRVVEQLIRRGRVARGWLGVEIEARIDDRPGLEVARVMPGSPAEKAGIRSGDRLLAVDGVEVNRFARLARTIGSRAPGTRVKVKLLRNGKPLTVTVVLGERPGAEGEVEVPREAPAPPAPAFPFGPRLGIQYQPLTPDLARYFGVEEGEGVLVAAVEPGSAADRAGIEVGDCIVAVGDEKVRNGGDLRRLVRLNAGRTVTFQLIRNRKPVEVKVTLPAASGLNRSLEKTLRNLRETLERYRHNPALQRRLRRLQRDLEELREALEH